MAQEQRELSAAVLSLNTPHVSLKARITAAKWQNCPQVGHNLFALKSKAVITSTILTRKYQNFSRLLKACCCQTGYSPLLLGAKYFLQDTLTLLV